MFLAIDHPAIACYDVQKQIDWYCRFLGMKVIASNGQIPPGVVVGYGDDGVRGGAMIELMPARDLGPKPQDMPRFCAGIRHIAMRVSNFESVYATLKNSGIEFLFEPGQAVGGGKIVSFRDPEGNELQIVER